MNGILKPSEGAAALDSSKQLRADLTILEGQTKVLHDLVFMNIKSIGKLNELFRIAEQFTRFQD